MSLEKREVQGHDSKGSVYGQKLPFTFLAENEHRGSYDRAVVAATLAGMHLCDKDGYGVGLSGARVMDIGSGWGPTMAAIAQFGPAEIACVDKSEGMTTLLEGIFGQSSQDHNLAEWLEERGAKEELGDLFVPAVELLKMRQEHFRISVFGRNRGKLSVLTANGLSVADHFPAETFDAVIGANYLHWPVNEERRRLVKEKPDWSEEQIRDQAIKNTLTPIVRILRSGGVAIFMAPKEFFYDDVDSVHEADYEAHTIISSPLHNRFHEIFSRLLMERYGKEWKAPKNVKLFPRSRLCELSLCAGFRFEGVTHYEYAFSCNPISTLTIQLQKLLGELDIPVEAKVALGQEVRQRLLEEIPEESELRRMPLWSQNFYMCFIKM